MSSSAGQKITTDPRSNQEIHEAVGIITSDSLAAESLKGDGSFGDGNPHAAASKQPSKSTTTNVTDTSNAARLEPALDAEAREAQEGWSETSQLNAGRGLSKDSDVGPMYGTTGGSADEGNVPVVRTGGYVGSAGLARNHGDLKPKGENIIEGGFDNCAPNASFNQEIGTKKDPGRVAEANFQLRDVHAGIDARGGPRQGGITGGVIYDVLKNDERA
ncbi:uncharacterized protein BDR25DRAFT_304129 [Lindgomyces ingoldianus]|uniref:Uncharacterized protein n=1 Tax=Lindgomyces ingoldianus TaxID=673940 RepID=A0ACB6QV87_9PLEO|nr:uncharacterized protein BDR25DRAFT_304129 [Lindgomyces ingoldianus]KAF2470187.1 hypothetical protein BDR25DRAFT_304129 [Lindgomyces ingoldianus]